MIVTIFLAAAAVSPTCSNLARDFKGNEMLMAWEHDLNQEMYDIDKKFMDNMKPSTFAAIEAGSQQAYLDWTKWGRNLEISRKKMHDSDQEYIQKGDRITQLIIANKCTPPDHVTNYYTYSKKNPKAIKP